jgi:hypothetical protein
MSFIVCNIDIKKYNFEDLDMKCIKWLFILVFFIHANVFASDSILTWGEIINALGGQEAYLKLPIFNPDGIVRHIGRILPEMMEKPIMRGKYGPRKNDIFVAFKWVDTQDNKMYAFIVYPSYMPYPCDGENKDEYLAYIMHPDIYSKKQTKEDVNERDVFVLYSDRQSIFHRCHNNNNQVDDGYQIEYVTKHMFTLEEFIKFAHGEVINYKCINPLDPEASSTIKGALRLFNETLDKDNYDPVLIDVERSFNQKIIGYVISEKEYNDLPFVSVPNDTPCLINDGHSPVHAYLSFALDQIKDAIQDLTDESHGYEARMITSTMYCKHAARALADFNDCTHVGRSSEYISLESMSAPMMRSLSLRGGVDRLLALKLVNDFDGAAHVVILSLDSDRYTWDWYDDWGGLNSLYREEWQSPNIFFREAFNPNPIPALDMHDLVMLKRLCQGETVKCNDRRYTGFPNPPLCTVHLEKTLG